MRPWYLRTLDILSGLAGVYAGFQLARHPELEPFKLLNIVGISFDIVGVVILSYVLIASEKVKAFIVRWVVTITISILGLGPLGFFIGFLLTAVFVSHPDHFTPFFPLLFAALPSVFFLEDTVYGPWAKRFQNMDSRTKALGGYFLLAGLFLQLYAAILDLNGAAT